VLDLGSPEPNALSYLAYLGFIILAFTFITWGIGLIKKTQILNFHASSGLLIHRRHGRVFRIWVFSCFVILLNRQALKLGHIDCAWSSIRLFQFVFHFITFIQIFLCT